MAIATTDPRSTLIWFPFVILSRIAVPCERSLLAGVIWRRIPAFAFRSNPARTLIVFALAFARHYTAAPLTLTNPTSKESVLLSVFIRGKPLSFFCCQRSTA